MSARRKMDARGPEVAFWCAAAAISLHRGKSTGEAASTADTLIDRLRERVETEDEMHARHRAEDERRRKAGL